jgi:hypothetical protein
MSAVACQKSEMPIGNTSLGIERFEVRETASVLEKLSNQRLDTPLETGLVVLGFDATGNKVASLELKIGKYWNDNIEQSIDGKTMDITIQGLPFRHESDFNPVHLPRRLPLRVMTFLQDPHVAPSLAKFKVDFAPGPQGQEIDPTAEEGYHYGDGNNCTYAWPSGSQPVASCCEWYEPLYNSYGEDGCTQNGPHLFFRQCTFAGDQNNPCPPAGPNGCGRCGDSYCWTHCHPGDQSNGCITGYLCE